MFSENDVLDGIQARFRQDGTPQAEQWAYQWTGLNLTDSDGWANLVAPMSSTWTDAEAIAAGWNKLSSSTSFVDVFSNVLGGGSSDIGIWTGSATDNPPTGSIIGYDNYGFLTVPEPTAGLLLLAGLSLAFTRRR